MIILRFKKKMLTPLGEEWLDIDLEVENGDFVSLFGKTGVGKTTFLRILAGLTKPEEGYIEVNGEVWFDSKRRINRSIQWRKAGFIFQETRLFPQMTIKENLKYASRDRKARHKIGEWFAAMDLEGLENQMPHQISGGQKQKVALIQVLINQPKILLLDEPLTGLDIFTRLNLQDEIIKAYHKTKITTILVSHDLSEVFKLSRKVFVIEQGRVIKSGTPEQVFLDADLSGKFKFTGEIIGIHQDGVLNILTIGIGNQVAKVVATDEEIFDLSVGSKVIIAAKAFNPLILKA